MSWVSQKMQDVGLGGLSDAFNSQPAWAKDLEIGGLGALATGGIGLAAGAFDLGALGLGGAEAAAGGGAAADVAGGAGTDFLGGVTSLNAASDFGAVSGGTDILSGGGASALPFAPDASSPSVTSAFNNIAPGEGFGAAGGGGGAGAAPADVWTGLSADPAYGGATTSDVNLGAMGPSSAPGGGGAGQGTFWGNLTDAASPANMGMNVGKAVANPMTALGVGGLGYNLYQGYQQKQQLNALQNTENANAQIAQNNALAARTAAAPQISTGEQLQQYLTTGTLPDSMQAQVDQSVNAAKAAAAQGYASRGMSSDPMQNSSLQADFASIDARALALKGTLETQLNTAGTQMVQTANQLIATGTTAANVASQIPIAMQGLDIQLGTQTSNAISNFAAAINGRPSFATAQNTHTGTTLPAQQAP